jgi:phosphoribosylformimino-5-aminoimidazole carboxamide ribotide isomerase
MVAGVVIESSSAVALAKAYIGRCGVTGLYAADLDAILARRGEGPTAANGHVELIRELAALGVPLWLDAAVTSTNEARRAIGLGVARVVAGLETLPSYDILAEICEDVGRERVAFSLDLQNGEPIVTGGVIPGERAHVVASRAAAAGVGCVIAIDLARVGTGAGPDFELMISLRTVLPGVMLLAGGGVRGPEDVTRLAEAGCDGVLVATALQTGHLTVRRQLYNPTR